MNDYLVHHALSHGEIKINSWKAPRVQTGDGSLYKLNFDRTMTDEDSLNEYNYYLKNKTNASIQNALAYLKKQAGVLSAESRAVSDLRLKEIKKIKSDEKFLEECFKRMDELSEDSKSYSAMRSIIFGGWRALSDKYSSDILKDNQRQLEKDSRTYYWNTNVIINDILGDSIRHSCDVCEPKRQNDIVHLQNEYRWNIGSLLDGQKYYPSMYDYNITEETKISDEIARLYEKSRNIKLPLAGWFI